MPEDLNCGRKRFPLASQNTFFITVKKGPSFIITNVLISAILSPRGKPAFILKLALRGVVELVLSKGIIEEMQKVLHYPKLHPFPVPILSFR
jgi:hypothetical protein